mmetsp:Transcript_18485/g.33971  ORF Transcript_18485/g.33971 Transcript_18485/m.33971 type:complete len:319 (+) Transcript_18485:187-1143(+)|eukprot:CAMPEP_0201891020 /NCGR_PEP_ID=MMETSP0902-20130614/33461_1 /ASSEMBLY_ACC=CAM_ASM_000551 /TAXON_ID=420261 /ORGANISM="Thalassiosira antarctica, Strain CCMP982" /LENGTH=318 /DNA_ID=CAMNT_0048422057 /DNA_START=133 /DNA_END=1089 /DNA_ORIENTATION=+
MIHTTQVLVLALAASGSSANGSKLQCGELEYCGGGHGDLSTEISCTCFPVKQKDVDTSPCGHVDVPKFTGGNPLGANAWYATDQDDDAEEKNYWVFHGCDGAGLMDDCMGGTGYVEQFGTYSDESVPLALHECSDGWESHCTQPFVHPGTGNVYSWYYAGQWTWGGGNWPDQSVGKPWWDNMGLPDTWDLGYDEGTGFVVMYPWVCNYWSGNDLGWLWGEHKPYGDSTYQTKCYYDNEPWDNDHDHGTITPPIWTAYKFYSDGATLTGWKMAEKKMDSPDPIIYFNDPNNPSFTLEGMSPPWANDEKKVKHDGIISEK